MKNLINAFKSLELENPSAILGGAIIKKATGSVATYEDGSTETEFYYKDEATGTTSDRFWEKDS